LRADDIFYATAVAILMAWLVFGVGGPAPVPERTPPDSPAPRMTHSAPAPPPVVAEVTVDDERFYILVGDGPPSFGVAVGGQ